MVWAGHRADKVRHKTPPLHFHGSESLLWQAYPGRATGGLKSPALDRRSLPSQAIRAAQAAFAARSPWLQPPGGRATTCVGLLYVLPHTPQGRRHPLDAHGDLQRVFTHARSVTRRCHHAHRRGLPGQQRAVGPSLDQPLAATSRVPPRDGVGSPPRAQAGWGGPDSTQCAAAQERAQGQARRTAAPQWVGSNRRTSITFLVVQAQNRVLAAYPWGVGMPRGSC